MGLNENINNLFNEKLKEYSQFMVRNNHEDILLVCIKKPSEIKQNCAFSFHSLEITEYIAHDSRIIISLKKCCDTNGFMEMKLQHLSAYNTHFFIKVWAEILPACYTCIQFFILN